MGTTTFLSIPVVKGDVSIVPDFPGGVRKLAANAVTRTFNKEYITELAPVSPAVAGVNSTFKYSGPLAFSTIVYESTLTVGAIVALDV